jgi:hypothetical protein
MAVATSPTSGIHQIPVMKRISVPAAPAAVISGQKDGFGMCTPPSGSV